MKLRKTAVAGLAALMVLLSACYGNSPAASSSETTTSVSEEIVETVQAPEEKKVGEIRDMTTQEIVHDMGMGINLGNTLESCGDWISAAGGVSAYERAWGSPIITQEMIQGYANEGFGVLRVPVAWSNLMAEDYTISPDYLARADEIIGWAIDSGMYVIMNIHYDGGWWENFPTETEECMKKYTRIWEQLSDYFGDYGDKLIFESLNEEGGWDSIWNRYSGSTGEDKERSYGLLNEINQKFVDIVRGSGGNNEKRHLLIAGYGTDIDLTCDELYKMPDDPAGRCAVSVHYYTPSTFCLLEKDADWGKAKKFWGKHYKDIDQLTGYMDMLEEHFVKNGVPVIIGEYGCVAVKNKEPFQVRRFNLCVAELAYTKGMCPVLWDITGVFYDRYSCTLKDTEFKEGLAKILSGESVWDSLFEETEETEQTTTSAYEAA